MVFTAEGFFEVVIESWPEWDLKATTTEFCSDSLTHWAIRPWVQLRLRSNFIQLLQFYFFVKCSQFVSAIAFVSRHICFKRNFAQVITLITLYIWYSREATFTLINFGPKASSVKSKSLVKLNFFTHYISLLC